jgi:hypothetical protein
MMVGGMPNDIEAGAPFPITDGSTEKFGFTYGKSHTQSTWGDTRRTSWPDLVEMLTSHVPGAKEGDCLVPAVFSGAERKKEQAVQIDVAFLDSDSGATLEDIIAALKARGWEAVVSSTHSHMTTRTEVNKTNWDRHFAKYPDSDATRFLVKEKGYLDAVAAGASAVGIRTVTVRGKDAELIDIEHEPCPKFRVAVPLAKPWRASDFPSQAAANDAWKERIEALASALDLPHDQACTDTSRLFYLPRRPPNGAVPETAVVAGRFCDIFALSAPKPVDLFAGPGRANGHAARNDGLDDGEYTDPATGEFVDLVTWARERGRTFLIVRAIRSRAPGKLTGYVAEGSKFHIDCPNTGAHTNPQRDGATFVVDSGNGKTEGFAVHCRHGHCDGKDRLFFVRKMLEERWFSIADLTSPDFHVGRPEPANDDTGPEPVTVIATSLALLDLDNIPPRRWIYGRELVRNYVSVLAGPGGAGKTAYTMAAGVSIAAGVPLLAPAGVDKVPTQCVVHKPGAVWFFNLEDPMEEMRRRIKATLQHHKIPVPSVANRIFIDSGRDKELIIAIRNRQGELVASPIVDPLVDELKARGISVLIVDPFVQSHAAEENRNEEMNLVMALWGRVATRADCAVWLVHHFRKGGKGGDAESIRGAGAIQGAARSMFTVSSMTTEEASKLGIEEDQRWQYIRHDNAKQNMAPPAGVADWYRLASVPLNNGDDEYPDGDFVQAVEAWAPPSPWDGLPWTMIERILVKIDQGPGDGEFYALGKQSKDRWAGRVIMDDACKTDGQAAAILKAWKDSGLVEDGQYSSPQLKGRMTGCVRVNQAKLSEMRQTFSTRTPDDE